jgi:hypothetical protein
MANRGRALDKPQKDRVREVGVVELRVECVATLDPCAIP